MCTNYGAFHLTKPILNSNSNVFERKFDLLYYISNFWTAGVVFFASYEKREFIEGDTLFMYQVTMLLSKVNVKIVEV